MENAQIILGLLKQLSTQFPHITCSSKCCYTDGRGTSFHQIHIRWKQTPKEKIVMFQMETGKLIASSCQGLSEAEVDTVIDVLLDIMNEESLVLH